ncbi:MAG: cation diffusion facilitator family transporter [Myxococcota bacterium]
MATDEQPARPGEALIAVRASLAVGVAVLALKIVAYLLTGSIALYSDALESVVNVVAAGAAWVALKVSARPPDAEHPFGHSKAEYFSAVFEGVLIVVAAVSIVQSAWERLHDPLPLSSLGWGVGLSVIASVGNGGLGAWLIRKGRKLHSPALVADGKHLWTDVVTTVGVLGGIAVASVTEWWILDPVLAIVVAVNIIWTGWGLVRESVGGLMDEAIPDDELESIREALSEHMGRALQAHDLKTRRAARHTFVQFHLVVPADMPVAEAHDICDDLEEALGDLFPEVHVTIHIEPEAEAEPSPFVMGRPCALRPTGIAPKRRSG